MAEKRSWVHIPLSNGFFSIGDVNPATESGIQGDRRCLRNQSSFIRFIFKNMPELDNWVEMNNGCC